MQVSGSSRLPPPASDPPRGSGGLRGDSWEFQRECVKFFAELVQALGAPRSLGQIYGLLFASSRSLTFTDIVEQLGISKGSVSQGLRILRSLGAVQNVTLAPDNREYFRPELGLRNLLSGLLREKMQPLLAEGGVRLLHLQEAALKGSDPQSLKFSRGRVKQIESWRRQMGLMLPLLKVLLDLNAR
jgi:DNA-binding transcriptional regulator GbsR (MarR family)